MRTVEQIRKVFGIRYRDNFAYFSIKTYVVGTHWKTYVVGTHWNRLEAIPMSTHNVSFMEN